MAASTQRQVSLAPTTRLVVLTNLHNPSSALADPAAVAAIAEAAAHIGALVFIDEVYLELTAEADAARTAFRPDGNIVVTGSLTKAYGLSGLRCGCDSRPGGAGRADAAPERSLCRRPASYR